MRQRINEEGRFPVYADAFMDGKAIDIHKEIKSKTIQIASNDLVIQKKANTLSAEGEQKLDISNWLPFAAKKYHISPDIHDYIFVPVLTIPSDIPNRNGVAFPLKTLLEFNIDAGCQGYKTFRGKPVHYEHQNKDPVKAKGVIVDSFLRPMKGFGNGNLWKVMLLLAIDRTKDVNLSGDIMKGNMNSYSMGAYVDKYTCSYCGSDVGKCEHIPLKSPVAFYKKDGKLVFKNMHGMLGFECSSVGTPAWSPATSDIIYT